MKTDIQKFRNRYDAACIALASAVTYSIGTAILSSLLADLNFWLVLAPLFAASVSIFGTYAAYARKRYRQAINL